MSSEFACKNELKLIPVRSELRLYPASSEQGCPGWTLEDPVRNQFFRLGRHQVEQLARWDSGTASQLSKRLEQEAGLSITEEEVAKFQRFLLANALLDAGHSDVQAFLSQRQARLKNNWLLRIFQSYIFFRIPLWRPERFLKRTLKYVRPLASPFAFGFYLLLLLCSLIFLAPQWSTFFNSFQYFISWQGAAAYMAVLFSVKFLHELGHAYTATAHGLKVPVIGVALIVLWPMLYSDNTDAWKKKDSTVRMKVVIAGMATEIVVAIMATFLWTVLQPGLLRSLCFILATSSWISSLMINLSPFMRFDGYYLMSDYLRVPNLAQRSFALGKWYLRRILLGMDETKPEYFPPRLEKILTLYCYGTWIYRLVLFTGIALMVYHLFFKALGVFLFAIEIYFFILKPVAEEFCLWWRNRQIIGCNGNVVLTTIAAISFIGALIIPWPVSIVIPALLTAKDSVTLYAPFAAQLELIQITNGQYVEKGDLLFTLSSRYIQAQQKINELEIKTLKDQLKREMVSKTRIEDSTVTENQLTAALIKERGYLEQQEKLHIISPISGRIERVPDGIESGSWIGFGQSLCHIVSAPGQKIVGYILDEDLPLFPEDPRGSFTAESGDLPSSPCIMLTLDSSNQPVLTDPELASVYGGDIAVVEGERSSLHSVQTRYRIEFEPLVPLVSTTTLRGHVVVKGNAISLIERAWRYIAPGIIREGEL